MRQCECRSRCDFLTLCVGMHISVFEVDYNYGVNFSSNLRMFFAILLPFYLFLLLQGNFSDEQNFRLSHHDA